MNRQMSNQADVVLNEKLKPRRRPLSRKKLWTFRFFAICFPLILILVLEFALRLFQVGTDLHLVQKVESQGSEFTHRLNPSIELAYYPMEVSGPEPRAFTLPKPEKVFRIVCQGGSTVIGFPYASELAFPRQIEVLLSLQNPEIEFEVLNAGVTSMNSFVVADLTEEALECDPDLLIVHTGHNEFYGPGGPASAVGNLSPNSKSLLNVLRRSRTGQLLSKVKPIVSDEENLLDALPTQFEIPLESESVRQAKQNLLHNLNRIVKTALEAKVPLVLSNVSSNLRDQSPMRPLDEIADQAKRVEWEQLVSAGEAELLLGNYESALDSLNQAANLSADHSRLKFREAQCLQGLGRNEEARITYRIARDLDGCRFRAPSSFRQLIENVAEEQDNELVTFVNIVEILNSKSHLAGPGYDFYLEHVHYNYAGHFELALAFAEHIQTEVLEKKWKADAIPNLEEMKSLTGYILEDDLAAYSLSIEVLKTAPFQECIDLGRHFEHLIARITGVYGQLSEDRQRVFADMPMEMVGDQLIQNLAASHLTQGDRKFAEELFERKELRIKGLKTEENQFDKTAD